jgi:hypothetical protein
LRVTKSASRTGVITNPVGSIEHIEVIVRFCDAALVAGTQAETVGIVLIEIGRAASSTLKGSTIIEPKTIGPKAGGHTSVGEGILEQSSTVSGAHPRQIVESR